MKTVTVGEIAIVRMGETLIAKNLTGNGLPVYSAGMENRPWGYTANSKLFFRRGTIVISARGSIGFPKIPDHEKFISTQTTIAVQPLDNGLIDSEYLCNHLTLIDFKEFTRSAAIPMITVKQISGIKLPLPPLTEQRRIIARIKECMERVEEVGSLRAEVLKEAENLAPSLYAAMAKSDQWPMVPVGDLVTMTRNGKSIRQDNENVTGYVLSLSAVYDVSLNMKKRKPITLPDKIADQYKIAVGDVFVSRSNTRELVGLASVATETPECIIYPDLLIKLDAKKNLIRSRFLAYALRTPKSRKQIQDRAVGTSQSMVKISGQRLKEVKIPVPPLKEQDALINRFDELHDLTSGLIRELQSLNPSTLKQAVLRKAFAGEL